MNIHEYQAKEILKRYGVTVPLGRVAFTPEEAEEIYRQIGGRCVVKAQIHAGGRGKAGGIKLVNSPSEAKEAASSLLGKPLVTYQTGPEGKVVRKVLVEKAYQIERELYLGMVIDRSISQVVMMASEEGGVEIEKVAAERPEKILKEAIDPVVGFMPYQGRKLAYGLNLDKALIGKAVNFMSALYKTFVEADCSLAEINPLVVTKDGEILALDAKINLDDNGLFRHRDLEAMRDVEEEDPLEVEAARYGISYIKLDGNIGCMVNGAGLAMSTMDIIKLCGGEPANFLDVGGGASKEQVYNAFKILLSDKNVKAVLVNIFGGIMKCDVIAQGVVEAIREVGLQVPLVVRLEGTNVELGREILKNSGLNIISATSMKDAAIKVVEAARNYHP